MSDSSSLALLIGTTASSFGLWEAHAARGLPGVAVFALCFASVALCGWTLGRGRRIA